MTDPHVTYDVLVQQHLKILRDLQTNSGLFLASRRGVKTGYDKAWLRDNFYECLAFEQIGDWDTVRHTYQAILKIFLKHEVKIDWALKERPAQAYQYIHARYNPESFDEFWEEWGNKQNDAVGCILFKVAELEERGMAVLESDDERRIVQKLVDYLVRLEYWHDSDSGIWEEREELHASSVGACLAGLKKVKTVLPYINVPDLALTEGRQALDKLLPRESPDKFVDLALLTLIYPYDIVSARQRDDILANIEYHLVKEKGVIRYKGDHYYNKNPDGRSEEAEWTFGLAFLSIIYHELGNEGKAHHYLELAKETITPKGEEPELYFSHTSEFNENTPLGWAESMLIVAIMKLYEKHQPVVVAQ